MSTRMTSAERKALKRIFGVKFEDNDGKIETIMRELGVYEDFQRLHEKRIKTGQCAVMVYNDCRNKQTVIVWRFDGNGDPSENGLVLIAFHTSKLLSVEFLRNYLDPVMKAWGVTLGADTLMEVYPAAPLGYGNS